MHGDAGVLVGLEDGETVLKMSMISPVFTEHEALLDMLAGQTTYYGPSGAGQVTKACNQVIVANTMQAISEALVYVEKAGVDLEAMVKALGAGAANCWTIEHHAPRMIRGEFGPGFFAADQYKDLRIATDLGDAYGAPTPFTEVTTEFFTSTTETGMGHDDNSGIIQVLERLAGMESRIDE